MRFEPKSNEELEVMDLIPEGIYNAQVLQAQDKLSKNGNEMVQVVLQIWDSEGRPRPVYDYLLPQMAKKLKHFAVAADLLERYEQGSILAEHCIGKCLNVEIIIQQGKQRPDGSGDYPAKNSVKDYQVKNDSVSQPVKAASESDFIEDDIPF